MKSEGRDSLSLRRRDNIQFLLKKTNITPATKANQASASTNQSKPPHSKRSSQINFCDYCHKPGLWEHDSQHTTQDLIRE